MKKFLINITIFSLFALLVHVAFAFLADGTTDTYYAKFSSPQQTSLVIGTSRAFQGIVPSAIDSTLNQPKGIYNYAFTLSSSPYSEVYYNAIRSKLSPDSKDGLFILTIDPWSISEDTAANSNFNDSSSVLFEMNQLSGHPNFEYLYKSYPQGWGMIPFKKFQNFALQKNSQSLTKNVQGSFFEIKPDGWMDVTTSMDAEFVSKKEKETYEMYEKKAGSYVLSSYRMDYLNKTIEYLKTRGKVFLVRLPVPLEMQNIEKKYMPNFYDHISFAKGQCDGYIDFNEGKGEYTFTDGNHLHKESAQSVSKEIGLWLNSFN